MQYYKMICEIALTAYMCLHYSPLGRYLANIGAVSFLGCDRNTSSLLLVQQFNRQSFKDKDNKLVRLFQFTVQPTECTD